MMKLLSLTLTVALAWLVCVRAQDSVDPEKLILDPARQRMVWDAEHVTFVIEQRFGKRFLAALGARDTVALGGMFRADLRGAVIGGDPEDLEERSKIGISESRRGGDPQEVSAKDLVAALVRQLGSIESGLKAQRFRVMKIEKKGTGDGAWRVQALLSAEGRSKDGALIAVDSFHQIEFETKSEAEFEKGAVVSAWKINSERERRAPQLLMEEVTVSAQLHRLPVSDNWISPENEIPQRYSFQFAVEDFDRDGFLDIAISSVRGPTAILKSLGGEKFAVANQAFGLPMMANKPARAMACWLDFDNDGYPDLILGDRVYRNEGGKKFVEITEQSGLVFGKSPMGCAVADYDGDGLCDLYVLYQGASVAGEALPWVGDDISGASNVLWRNLGGGKFEDVTEKSGAGGGRRNSFAATWLYSDGDAWPDLYVANDFGKNCLLRNRGDGTFEDIAAESGAADFATSMGVTSGDLDNDGSPEIYVANMYSKMGRRIIGQVHSDDYAAGVYDQIKGACAGNRLYRRGIKAGRYSETSEDWGINDIGWAYAPAMADLDNDGLLDLHATTGFLSFERGKPDG